MMGRLWRVSLRQSGRQSITQSYLQRQIPCMNYAKLRSFIGEALKVVRKSIPLPIHSSVKGRQTQQAGRSLGMETGGAQTPRNQAARFQQLLTHGPQCVGRGQPPVPSPVAA